MPGEISLPPPIRDPISGKVFVAIPAPPFVLAKDGTALDESHVMPGYVYVERKEIAATRMFSKDRTSAPTSVLRRSVGQWTCTAASSPPPPQHVPWHGDIPPASSADSISSQTTTSRTSQSSTKTGTCDRSSSSIDLPSFESGFSLIRGRLPPAVSSVTGSESSANMYIPSFTEVTARRPHSYATPGSQTSDSHPTERRACCETVYANNREAHVFRRRPELGSAETIRQTTILTPQFRPLKTRSCERRLLDDTGHATPILEESGVMDEDTPVQHSRAKLEKPSLVVSTSHHTTLVSLDSTRQVQISATKPLKIVKKPKRVPAPLKLDIPKRPSAEYPDVPTPFCSSPKKGGTRDSCFVSSVYPRLYLDTKLSTEEMIESLLKQVEHFKPKATLVERPPTALGYCMLDDAASNTGGGLLARAVIGLGLDLEQSGEGSDTSISSTTAEKPHCHDDSIRATEPKTTAIRPSTPRTPTKSSIAGGRSRSNTTSSSSSSEKRVRFNSGLNRRISAVIPEKDEPVSALRASPPRSPPAAKTQRPAPATVSAVSSITSSPKRTSPAQTQTSPRNNRAQPQSPQQFKTFQYQKRTSMRRMSLASAGLMSPKSDANANAETASNAGISTPSAVTPKSLAFPTLTRATRAFTPSPFLPRRRMTETLPSPSAIASATPRTFGFGSGTAYVTPTPASGTMTGVARRMTLASTPRMRSITVGVARGKENRGGESLKVNAKEIKENREKEKENKENGKRLKASEALLAKKRHEVDENEMRRGVGKDSERGIMKGLPFQGVLNRLKA